MHIMHTLYHIKRQYANTHPHGCDEKQKRYSLFLTFAFIIGVFFYFFKQNQ